MKIDYLTFIGLFGQFLFFLRFVIQWYYTEKHNKVVIPKIFWYLSIGGALIIFIYSYFRQDIVFMSGSIFSLIIYGRNLYLSK